MCGIGNGFGPGSVCIVNSYSAVSWSEDTGEDAEDELVDLLLNEGEVKVENETKDMFRKREVMVEESGDMFQMGEEGKVENESGDMFLNGKGLKVEDESS